MPFKAVIPVFLAHIMLTSAMPNPISESTGFSVDLIKRHLPEKRVGGVTASVGVVSTTSHQDKWTIDLIVGNQTLPTVIDTGSSGFWYESVMQQPDKMGSGHPVYTPTATAKSISGGTFTAVYTGDKTAAAGVAYYEKVQIGAATLTSQVVGAATYLAETNTNRKSGLVGLGPGLYQDIFDSAVKPRPNTITANLMQQLNITQFALDLRYDNKSRLDFGFIDSTRYTGPLTYINRNFSYTSWYIPLDNVYYVNNARLSGKMSDNDLTLVDSGAPSMTFPAAVVQEYYKAVAGSGQDKNGYWQFPCVGKNQQLPSFGVSINGVTFTVPGTWMWAYQSNATFCQGSLQVSKWGNSFLGDTFLRTVYTVFDTQYPKGPGKIGFATKPMPTRVPPA